MGNTTFLHCNSAPIIETAGNSGCKVEIVSRGGGIAVKKSCGFEYSDRLENQLRKQEAFRVRLKSRSNLISVPITFDAYKDETGYWAEMEYFPYWSFGRFLSVAGIGEIDSLCESIIDFLDFGMSGCVERQNIFAEMSIKVEEISNKYYAKHGKKLNRELLDWILKPDISLPIAPCHGDFTLSNILIQPDGRKIALVDFLDSFVDSPALDYVKVRQDTHLYWSLLMINVKMDRARIQACLRYLDEILSRNISKYHIDDGAYRRLQSLNLLRILPYATNDQQISFIFDSINKLRK
jgi:hypothetical protein